MSTADEPSEPRAGETIPPGPLEDSLPQEKRKEGVGVEKSQGNRKRRPSREQIRTVAYLKYLDEGRVEGRDIDHWLEAERLLTQGDEGEPSR